nr:MAG TPA: hypothetical protein [Caudoviricetes sp.]
MLTGVNTSIYSQLSPNKEQSLTYPKLCTHPSLIWLRVLF